MGLVVVGIVSWRSWRMFVWIAAMAIAFVGVHAIVKFVLMRSYPIHERSHVAEAAALFDADPFLILSVMKVESGFDSEARSHVGAIGLMQIMPETADWIVNDVKPAGLEWIREGWSESELYDPRKNILIGAWYLSYLLRRFGRLEVALAAYNGGQGRVSTWLEAEQVRPGDEFSIDDIPLAETRSFVRRVLAVKAWYDRLYRGRFDS